MGTRADFYIGRGPSAEWLGSIAWDGYPDGIIKKPIRGSEKGGPVENSWDPGEHLFDSTTPEEFKARLGDFFRGRDDVTSPLDGWPWPWDDSRTSDFAYCFDQGRVWFWGKHRDHDSYCWIAMDGDCKPVAFDDETPRSYPNMKERQKVTYGARSGLTILGVKAGDK